MHISGDIFPAKAFSVGFFCRVLSKKKTGEEMELPSLEEFCKLLFSAQKGVLKGLGLIEKGKTPKKLEECKRIFEKFLTSKAGLS